MQLYSIFLLLSQIIYSFKHMIYTWCMVGVLQMYLSIGHHEFDLIFFWFWFCEKTNVHFFGISIYVIYYQLVHSIYANKTIGITHLFPLLEHLLYILLMSYLEALICLFILCLVISGILFSSKRIVVGYPFSNVLQLKPYPCRD